MLADYVAALESTWSGLVSVGADLTEDEWARPTDLPGWSVKDNVSHIVGIELLLLGEPFPSSHVLPASLPHVKGETGRFMEVPVDLRRPASGAAVHAELRDVTARRLAALRSLPASAWEEETPWFFGGTRPLSRVLANRVFDSWAHEQDVRRAVGRPGGLSSPAARASLEWLLRALAGVVPRGAVAVETTGPVVSSSVLRDGSVLPGTGEADARVTMNFETFARLACGRARYADLASSVSVSGDVALAEEVLRNAAVTP